MMNTMPETIRRTHTLPEALEACEKALRTLLLRSALWEDVSF